VGLVGRVGLAALKRCATPVLAQICRPAIRVVAAGLAVAQGFSPAIAQQNPNSVSTALFPNAMRLERAFVKAGGLLVAGTDSTGSGGVVPGFADQRQIELLVDAGFTPIEAIAISTLNGAKYLGRDARIGSIASGKQADLVVVAGDPSTAIADIRRVDTVFKNGIGFDPAQLIESVRGQVGIW
jgi:imidazolonepropionase-like amidohydrolase